MSYYAKCDGVIHTVRKMTDSEIHDVRCILDAFDCYDTHFRDKIGVRRDWDDYDDDAIKDSLINLADYLAARANGIDDANLEWNGEDRSQWRFVFEDGEWLEQIAYVEWGDSHSFKGSD